MDASFLVLIGALAAVLVFTHFRRRNRHRRYVLNCDDASVTLEASYAIADDRYQVPTRILGPVEVVIREIELYQTPSQKTGSSIDGLQYLRRSQDFQVEGTNICPYADQFVDFIVANPETYPREWKYKNIWFFGRVYWRAKSGLFVRGIRWNYALLSPEAAILPLACNLGGNDYAAVVRMKSPALQPAEA